jgi:hypothetical protein
MSRPASGQPPFSRHPLTVQIVGKGSTIEQEPADSHVPFERDSLVASLARLTKATQAQTESLIGVQSVIAEAVAFPTENIFVHEKRPLPEFR